MQGKLVRVISINAKENRVVLFRYDRFEKEHIELDTAPLLFEPLFRIGEVAKFLQRSTETLRRYETSGLIPRARKYKLSKNGTSIRLYNEEDLMELADFFANRRAPGRPEKTNSKIDRVHLMKNINSRFDEWR